jgi:hypothetical protein
MGVQVGSINHERDGFLFRLPCDFPSRLQSWLFPLPFGTSGVSGKAYSVRTLSAYPCNNATINGRGSTLDVSTLLMIVCATIAVFPSKV